MNTVLFSKELFKEGIWGQKTTGSKAKNGGNFDLEPAGGEVEI